MSRGGVAGMVGGGVPLCGMRVSVQSNAADAIFPLQLRAARQAALAAADDEAVLRAHFFHPRF